VPEDSPRYLLDSSVLFSLDDGNVLDILWELHLSWCTTDLILAEWETVDTDSLIRSGLIAISLSDDDIAEIFRISPQYRKIKPSDLSLFLHASDHRDCIVITGDRRLRALCEGAGIPVHGVLWILDLIHDRDLLSRPDLIQALQAMIEKGNYLPEPDCQERVDRWESDE
jgi:predicted nucleic acid-binding protein